MLQSVGDISLTFFHFLPPLPNVFWGSLLSFFFFFFLNVYTLLDRGIDAKWVVAIPQAPTRQEGVSVFREYVCLYENEGECEGELSLYLHQGERECFECK